ncbi:MAG: hypothetical protein V1650_02760 [Candidatus Omnitrophota bacterium]
MDKSGIKNLKRRYLVWFYKTAKEAYDKLERKFTQSEIDRFILQDLEKADKFGRVKSFVDDFRAYIQKKEENGLSLKFDGKNLKSDYEFLVLRLKAVEKAIVKELGKNGLEEIKALYEKEMIERILKSMEH